MVKISKTSVNIDEFVAEENTIPFAPELIKLISKEKKLTTYRFGNKYDYLNVGDKVNIQNSDDKQIISKAIITTKHKTTFNNLPLATSGHETYKDKEHQRKVFSDYYAYIGRPIKDNDQFLILSFKLID